MERGSKTIAIVALLIGVVGLTLGFAAFSNTLTIKSGATVKPNAEDFNVDFSTTDGSVTVAAVKPTTSSEDVTATDATIDNSTAGVSSLTGLSATFTEPGQSATYTLYAHNAGQYIAYLNAIDFASAATCTPSGENPGTAEQVNVACTGISLTVQVGSTTATDSMDNATIGTHSLAVGTSEAVTVTIAYASDAERADGQFDVAFGDVKLTYESVD